MHLFKHISTVAFPYWPGLLVTAFNSLLRCASEQSRLPWLPLMAPSAVVGWDGLFSRVIQALLWITQQESLPLSSEYTRASGNHSPKLDTAFKFLRLVCANNHLGARNLWKPPALLSHLNHSSMPMHSPCTLQGSPSPVHTTLTAPSGPKVCFKVSQIGLLRIATAHVEEG